MLQNKHRPNKWETQTLELKLLWLFKVMDVHVLQTTCMKVKENTLEASF